MSDFLGEPPLEDVALSGEQLAQERAAYRAWHLAEHQSEVDSEAVFALIEEEDFLAEQVMVLGNYAAAGRTLELFALPAAEGTRFLHYAAVHLALQRLAGRLDDEPTARAILQVGRRDLIAGLAEQLTGPLERARIWALLAKDREGEAADHFRRQAAEAADSFLDSPLSVLGPEERACLGLLLEELAGDLGPAWARWQRSPLLDERLREELRLRFLRGLFRRGAFADPGTLAEARRCADLDPFAALLGSHLAGHGPGGLAGGGALLHAWRHEDPATAWRIGLQAGARLASQAGDLVSPWWKQLTAGGKPPGYLLDEGALPLLLKLDTPDLEPLVPLARSGLPAAMVALALAQQAPGRETLGRARGAVEAIADPEAAHFATLQLALVAWPCEKRLAQDLLRAVGDALAMAGYRADARNLGLYLRAVAAIEPRLLRRELQELAFAPGISPGEVEALADEVADEAVWRAFAESTERFALAAADDELAAFALRSRLLSRLGRRLPGLSGGLELLPVVTGKQLLEEEESLRLELAGDLENLGRAPEARKIVGAMPDGARKRLGEVRLLSSAAGEELDAAALFSALTDLASLEDELWGLRALLEAPIEIEESCERLLGRIADPDTRSLFVLHLLNHRVAFEALCFGKPRDPLYLIELARPLLAVEDERRLAALIPELVALGRIAGPKIALAELLESAEGLVRLTSLAEPAKVEAFEELVCFAGSDPRLGSRFFDALARLPALFEDHETLRIRAFRPLVPRVAALLETVPGYPAEAAGRWLGRLGQDWLLAEPGWPEVVGLCRAGPESRRRQSLDLVREGGSAELVDAAVVLSAGRDPAIAHQLLGRLPSPAARQRLAFRLLRLRLVAAEGRQPFHTFLDDEALQRFVRIEESLAAGDEPFLADLADAAAHGQFDTRDPAGWAALRRLWRCPPGFADRVLSPAVRRAFDRGPEAAEKALRLWLHLALAPQPGRERKDALIQWRALHDALFKARRLDGGGSA